MNLPAPNPTPNSLEALQRAFIEQQVCLAMETARQNPVYATPNLAKWFRKNRKLGSRDRKVVSEIVYLLIRFQDLFQQCGFNTAGDQCHALLEKVPLRVSGSMVERLAIHLSLPQWIIAQWHETLEDETAKLGHFIQSRAPIDIRVNKRRTTPRKVLLALQKANIQCQIIPNLELGIRIDGRAHLMSVPEYQQGWFEIQDAASQLFCEQLQIKTGERVLDLCAGAGGKALAFAATGATVYANEPRSKALAELKKRAQRSGCSISTQSPKNPVDTVVIDAPCSGSGRLRREPAIRWRWKEQAVLQHIDLQQQLLAEARQYLSPQGRIVYSTCSLLREENEHQLGGWSKTPTQYLWPHRFNCDGFAWSSYRR